MAFHSLEVKWQAKAKIKIKRIVMMMGNSEIGTGTREEMLLTQTLMEIRRANS